VTSTIGAGLLGVLPIIIVTGKAAAKVIAAAFAKKVAPSSWGGPRSRHEE
jgi:hypothetical protein